MRRFWERGRCCAVVLFLIIGLSACVSKRKPTGVENKQDSEVTASYDKANKSNDSDNESFPLGVSLQTREGPLSPKTKIFLVAGSSRNANFAQEIIDQKQLWLRAGFGKDEIACYYVVPREEELEKDRDKFFSLAPQLAQCYPGSVKLLRQHLLEVVQQQPKMPFLYLYVTSHGEKPISYRKPNEDTTEESALDQYRLEIESLPDGKASHSEILGAYLLGMDPRELFFTPQYLKEFLEKYFSQIPKFIVLQACFSGGFIEEPHAPFNEQVLSTLPHITVLTASRYDRPSFGCQTGPRTTYFGGAFNEVLAQHLGSPLNIDWWKVYEDIKEKVEKLERDKGESKSSEPKFYSDKI